MSTPRAVRVRWLDAAHTAHRWEDRQEVVNRVVQAQKVPIVSVGQLVHEDENGVLVCVSVNELDDVAECVSIPRSAIVAIADLREGES
jgi:hypothetical protein